MTSLVRVAWQTVSRRRLRSFLTALSLVLGVMALTSVAAASGVMQQTITRTALLTGGPTVTSSIVVTDPVDPVGTASRWADSIATRYGPAARTARVVGGGTLSLSAGGTTVGDWDIQLVDPSLTRIRPFETLSGTWLDGAPRTLAAAVVLNRTAAEQRGQADDWRVRWGDGYQTRAVVAGVVDDGSIQPTVYLDLTRPGAWVAPAVSGGDVRIVVHVPGVSDKTIRDDLRQTQQLVGATGATGDVQRTDTLRYLTTELDTTARVFFAVAVVALTVAAVGMLNIGLSTLAERSDELSLRRAFGAHRRDIVAIMLLEAQIVAVVAGACGVGLAYLALPLTLKAFGATSTAASFPWAAAALGVAAGILAALLGASTPALRAMRTPIATIMRG